MPAGNLARLTTRVTVRSNRTAQVIAQLTQGVNNAVTDSANDLATLASQLAPVRTGALRNSIYVNNGTNSNYTSSVATARSLNRDLVPLEELDPEFVIPLAGQNSGNLAVVGVAADYGIFLELGTAFHAPQTFMLPAAEAVSDDFDNRMRHILG